jgi:thymidylate kinase
MLISFSGMDGAGKSTQIDNLTSVLERSGLRVCRLAFWDDVVVFPRYRERFVQKVFKSEGGVGTPERPVERRDKNMRAWYLTLVRHFLYLLDTLHLSWVLARARCREADVLVMDRYIYDELVNLPLENVASRACFRLMVFLAPRPQLAFLLDAEPGAARSRKPEYPADFMRQYRGWYHRLARLLGTMTVIPPLPLSEAEFRVTETLRLILAERGEIAASDLPRSA